MWWKSSIYWFIFKNHFMKLFVRYIGVEFADHLNRWQPTVPCFGRRCLALCNVDPFSQVFQLRVCPVESVFSVILSAIAKIISIVGMPELKLGLNDKILMESRGSTQVLLIISLLCSLSRSLPLSLSLSLSLCALLCSVFVS